MVLYKPPSDPKCRLTPEGEAVVNEMVAWSLLLPWVMTSEGVQNMPAVKEELIPRKDISSGALISRRNKQARSESKRRARRVARDAGWERLGAGTVRSTYKPAPEHVSGSHSGQCVVKVSTWNTADGDGGINQNYHEIANWLLAPEASQQYITDVYDWDEGLLLWVLEEQADVSDPRLTEGAADEVEETLKSMGWRGGDVDAGNIGVLDDRVVVVDTGILYAAPEDEMKRARDVLRPGAGPGLDMTHDGQARAHIEEYTGVSLGE